MRDSREWVCSVLKNRPDTGMAVVRSFFIHDRLTGKHISGANCLSLSGLIVPLKQCPASADGGLVPWSCAADMDLIEMHPKEGAATQKRGQRASRSVPAQHIPVL